jgi:hypothetical protein
MIFKDYTDTGRVYHIVGLNDLQKCLSNGINYDDKKTYENKYVRFHKYFDDYKVKEIPSWVMRHKAIYASLNFQEAHKWHSHTAILGISINEDRSWVCNENIANFLFEPFILQDIEGFSEAGEFIKANGSKVTEDYWNASTSFKENLYKRNDLKEGYDAEILIMHNIPPTDIECLMIISDHKVMSCGEWRKFLKSNNLNYKFC